jgi:hypothetical protein
MNEYINRITFLTLRWIFSQNRGELVRECKSPEEIKALIGNVCTPTTESFEKGLKMIDFKVLYNYFHPIEKQDKEEKKTDSQEFQELLDKEGQKREDELTPEDVPF